MTDRTGVLERALASAAAKDAAGARPGRRWSWLWAILPVTAAIAVARHDYEATDLESVAVRARQRFGLFRCFAFVAGTLTVTTGGIALWMSIRPVTRGLPVPPRSSALRSRCVELAH